MPKDILNTHKRRELKKQRSRWIRPETIKTAFFVLRIVDLLIRIICKLL
ncbi:hypothetical protein DFO48_10154 [Comamonas sp. AG1104]|nr:hypothetical protein DFO48_10154 [Comamonas sp. AG1104]